ncbi:MAG TPA: LURP-one-related family protein [Candidatus Angelobacter sp.]
MRYVMKQKVFSLGDDFVIKDENGRDMFLVDGKAFSLGNHLAFMDMSGNKLASIDQELPWGRTYDIRKADQLWAVVHKKAFTFFNCQFTVNVPGQDDVLAEGNFSDHEYTFTRAGRPMAQVSKQWFTFSDTYGVEVDQQEDDILILASTVVIDLCCHPDDR